LTVPYSYSGNLHLSAVNKTFCGFETSLENEPFFLSESKTLNHTYTNIAAATTKNSPTFASVENRFIWKLPASLDWNWAAGRTRYDCLITGSVLLKISSGDAFAEIFPLNSIITSSDILSALECHG